MVKHNLEPEFTDDVWLLIWPLVVSMSHSVGLLLLMPLPVLLVVLLAVTLLIIVQVSVCTPVGMSVPMVSCLSVLLLTSSLLPVVKLNRN